MPIGDAKIEFVSPLGEKSPIAQFLTKNGEAMYLLSLDIDYLPGALSALEAKGIKANVAKTLDGNDLAFISPKHTHGVLLQLISRRS